MKRSVVLGAVLALCLLTAGVSAQLSLTTTFSSNNGQSGNMFDVVAANPVIINDFDVNLDTGISPTIEIYVVTGGGSWQGNETNSGAWTLLTTVPNVTSAGANTATNLGISLGFLVPAGVTQGFYVTVNAGTGMNYTNGSSVGAVAASNSDLQILEGAGKSYPFGSTFQPRVWNGTIHYTPGSGIFADFSGTPTAGNAPQPVSFTDQSFSSDPNGVSSWLWDFGDGTTSTSQNPTHTYTSAGSYTVSLTVSDPTNGSDTEVKANYINVSPPILVVTSPGAGAIQISGPPDPPGTTNGYFLVSAVPAPTVGGGPFFGLIPDAITFQILTFAPAPCGLFHYAPGNLPACFPQMPLSFGPGTVATGLTFDCVLIQVIGGATLEVSNVARVNT